MTRYFYYIDQLDGNRLRRTTYLCTEGGNAGLWGRLDHKWVEGSLILPTDHRISSLECVLLIPEAV